MPSRSRLLHRHVGARHGDDRAHCRTRDEFQLEHLVHDRRRHLLRPSAGTTTRWQATAGPRSRSPSVGAAARSPGVTACRSLPSGVTNPTTPSTGDVLRSRRRRTAPAAQTSTYAITAAQAPVSPSMTLSTTAAGATNVTYDVRFTASSTGALAATLDDHTDRGDRHRVQQQRRLLGPGRHDSHNCGYNNDATSNGGATITLTLAAVPSPPVTPCSSAQPPSRIRRRHRPVTT